MDQEFLMKDNEGIFYELKVNNMKTFNDLEFKQDNERGLSAAKVVFENGYGASVVIGEHTYGGRDGLYELAVLGKNGKLAYDTPITDDVEGYLTQQEVTDLMKLIQEL
jgi:hypothetical protein